MMEITLGNARMIMGVDLTKLQPSPWPGPPNGHHLIKTLM